MVQLGPFTGLLFPVSTILERHDHGRQLLLRNQFAPDVAHQEQFTALDTPGRAACLSLSQETSRRSRRIHPRNWRNGNTRAFGRKHPADFDDQRLDRTTSFHDVNQAMGKLQKVLQWQTGYGVVSFGIGDVDWVKAYIANQKEHHRCGKTADRLERCTVPTP